MEGWRQRRLSSKATNPSKKQDCLDSYRPSHGRSWVADTMTVRKTSKSLRSRFSPAQRTDIWSRLQQRTAFIEWRSLQVLALPHQEIEGIECNFHCSGL